MAHIIIETGWLVIERRDYGSHLSTSYKPVCRVVQDGTELMNWAAMADSEPTLAACKSVIDRKRDAMQSTAHTLEFRDCGNQGRRVHDMNPHGFI